MRRKIIVLLLAALLSGCHKLESGIVVNKHFVPAHYQPMTTVIYNGKTTTPVTQILFVPDKWHITIEGEYKGKTRREDFSIPESYFLNISVGDFIRVGEIAKKESFYEKTKKQKKPSV